MHPLIYNIYCDESRVENPESINMVIGALFVPRKDKRKISNKIKKICRKYNFLYELKWTKVNKRYLDFYKEIIDLFYEEKNLNFRCIVVAKNKIKLDEYHNNDPELAFFKFYYLMLRAKLMDQNKYYILLDKKPTRDKNRARALHAFLDAYVLSKKTECGIKHFQAYDSKNNILIQLADFFTGLMGFACNESVQDNLKSLLADYLKQKIEVENLCKTSFLSEEKFNRFIWNGK